MSSIAMCCNGIVGIVTAFHLDEPHRQMHSMAHVAAYCAIHDVKLLVFRIPVLSWSVKSQARRIIDVGQGSYLSWGLGPSFMLLHPHLF